MQQEIVEMKEAESRRLNIMVFNLPESEKYDVKDRQAEDEELLKHILEEKMNIDPHESEIMNPKRIGRREVVNGGKVKKRPLRFTVKRFDSKRKVMTGNLLLRKSKDDLFNKIYFTPDLTKKQREEAFKLREE